MTRAWMLAAGLALLVAVATGIVIGVAATSRGSVPAEPGIVVAVPTASASPTPLTATPTVTPAPLDAEVLRALLPARDQLDAYLAALQARDSQRWAAAATTFARVADGPSALAPVARLRQAQMLVRDGQPVAAVAAFDAAIAAPGLPPSLGAVAHQEASDALVPLGRREEARMHLDAIIAATASTRAQLAEAQWDRAQLRRTAGDVEWTADALAVVRSAPGTTEATAALNALERAEASVPVAVAAYARYRARDNATAMRLYTTITAAPPSAAEAASAWFFLGALAERQPDVTAAIAAYMRSIEAAPRGTLASDARWWLGLLLEERGRHLEAAAQFRQLVEDFPRSPFADAASIRAGVALAEGGAAVPAAAHLRAIAAGRDQRLAAEAARWLQVLKLATASDAAPATYLPTSFAAIAARDANLLAPLPRSAAAEWGSAPPDSAGVDRWMANTFGPRSTPPALLAEADLARGIALVAANEQSVGRALIYALLPRYRLQPYDLLDLMHVAEAADLPDVALEACELLFDRLDPAQRLTVPLAVERYAYPVAFPNETRAAAQAAGIPPLLLLALVRQESAFNRFAGSSAGAMGLTQVIEPTGRQIAATLREPWPADLFDASRSLRFGAHYLATQLKRFDGNVLAALAAYNGGPENADRWQDLQRIPGTDGYVYAIEFSETRGYIERVLENYATYRRLYAGAPIASVR